MVNLINIYGILAAAIVAMVVGGLWYSPFLFGSQWVKLRGKKSVTGKGMQFPATSMAIEFVCALVTAFVLSFFAVLLPHSEYAAIILALFIWVGFYVTLLLGEVVWEEKPFGLFLINAGLRLVNLILMTSILVMWR